MLQVPSVFPKQFGETVPLMSYCGELGGGTGDEGAGGCPAFADPVLGSGRDRGPRADTDFAHLAKYPGVLGRRLIGCEPHCAHCVVAMGDLDHLDCVAIVNVAIDGDSDGSPHLGHLHMYSTCTSIYTSIVMRWVAAAYKGHLHSSSGNLEATSCAFLFSGFAAFHSEVI